MWRAERRLGDQRAAGWQAPSHGMDRGDLERGGTVQAGQDGRDPFGQHRLACAGRPLQREVMTARRADLGGAPRSGLPEDVGQVRTAAYLATKRELPGSTSETCGTRQT